MLVSGVHILFLTYFMCISSLVSQSHTPNLPLPLSLFLLVTTTLFSISIYIFGNHYIYLDAKVK